MKRTRIELIDIAKYANLAEAAWKAGKGKRHRGPVRSFFSDFDTNVNRLARGILVGKMPQGKYRSFIIHDPKKRTIHAACFEDRILHHAIMNIAGPVLDRGLVPTTYACRVGKGTLAAVERVRHCIRRYPWYVKIDIAGYFDTVDHHLLFSLLQRRFKGNEFLDLLWRTLESYNTAVGKGLPIGSLTSQHFGNYYLDGVDRFLTEQLKCLAHVRYMDDIIWWCEDLKEAKTSLAQVKGYIAHERLLDVKETMQINRSKRGVTYCGFRVLPGTIRLTVRKRRLYGLGRMAWENAYLDGKVTELKLQNGYAAVHGMVAGCGSRQWRKKNLLRHPPVDV